MYTTFLTLFISLFTNTATPTAQHLHARSGDPILVSDASTALAIVTLTALTTTLQGTTRTPFNVTLATIFPPPNTTSQTTIPDITGLELTQVHITLPGVSVSKENVTCRRFTDEYAISAGSAPFGGADGRAASVSTNPVELGYVLCLVDTES